jgi:beta-amylase
LQIYEDYYQSFADNVLNTAHAQGTVIQVEISMGPAGEMRFPSYQFNAYPGVGEFQCYDQYLLADLSAHAEAAGQPQWGHGGPSNAGSYHDQPSQTGFWSPGTTDNYASDYGKFFLTWYSDVLLRHGADILQRAQRVFSPFIANGMTISGKVAGIHWQYKNPCHAAECTAGYYNTNQQNAYLNIARMFKKFNAVLTFTALELFDSDQCGSCGPQELVDQVHEAAISAGVGFSGENALPMYDQRHYDEVVAKSSTPSVIDDFTYLRLTDTLLESNNLSLFANFVNRMHSLG